MPHLTHTWTNQQLQRMKGEKFMVEFLDTFKLSPLTHTSDQEVEQLNLVLTRVEEQIQQR